MFLSYAVFTPPKQLRMHAGYHAAANTAAKVSKLDIWLHTLSP